MPTLVKSTRESQHGTWIEIRCDRLLANLKTLTQHAGPYSQVMAVVKANAYGHGLVEIAKYLSAEVAYLGVASVREALTLKEERIETPIFLFGRLLGSEIPAVLADGITLSVSSFDESRTISEVSESFGRRTPVHIKVDTGMGRLGIPFGRAFSEIEKMATLRGIALEGIYTHFPTAEREDGFTHRQLQDFGLLLQALEKKGITFRYRHAANSAGSLKVRTPILNLVRPGLMLYGLYPDISLRDLASVSPILSLKSRIISLKRLQPGESVGYGRDFVTDRPTTIAILPVGYSHGYPFGLSNRSFVLFKGRRHPIAGRVSMDYLAINLGDTAAGMGDEVTLLGEDEGEAIRAEDLAAWAQTIPYEIVTRLAPNLPRIYH